MQRFFFSEAGQKMSICAYPTRPETATDCYVTLHQASQRGAKLGVRRHQFALVVEKVPIKPPPEHVSHPLNRPISASRCAQMACDTLPFLSRQPRLRWDCRHAPWARFGRSGSVTLSTNPGGCPALLEAVFRNLQKQLRYCLPLDPPSTLLQFDV